MTFIRHFLIGLFIAGSLLAQDSTKSGFQFRDLIRLPTTSVKHQGRTGTCWIFSTISFLETELLRTGGDSVDLSEMYISRQIYPLKAQSYVRLHGKATFEEGGLAHDVIHVLREQGLVPESAYSGMYVEGEKHNHREMIAVLQGALDAIVQNRGETLSPVWSDVIEAILDVYLGVPPSQFELEGKILSPASFVKSFKINPDAYVSLTSYLHHPFYQSFVLEVPDNWSRGSFYNLPLDDFMKVIRHALKEGYSLVWDGDVSEKGCDYEKGIALLPKKKWEDKTDDEQDSTAVIPEPEIEVTQEIRQTCFDNYSSTDDHLMHLIGLAEDQEGTLYFIAKDSDSNRKNPYDGHHYLSESYMRAKTVSIMVHKDGIQKDIRKKIGL